jgi:hypothetical protein
MNSDIIRTLAILPLSLEGRSVFLSSAFLEMADTLAARGARIHVSDDNSQADIVLVDDLQEQRNPFLHLDLLSTKTRNTLVLRLRGKMTMTWPLNGARLVLWPARRKGQAKQAFYFSPELLHQYMKALRQDFAFVETHNTEDGFLVVAHKRKIAHLVILAGLPAIGKSTLLQHLRSSEGRGLGRQLGFDAGNIWHFTNYATMLKPTETTFENVFLQYNISAPLTHGQLHRYEFGLRDLIGTADKVTIATMWADAKMLLERYSRERIPKTDEREADYKKRRLGTKETDISGGRGPMGILTRLGWHKRSSHMRKKEERFLSLYSNQDALLELYSGWFKFIQSLNCSRKVITQSPSYEAIDLSKWQEKLKSDA